MCILIYMYICRHVLTLYIKMCVRYVNMYSRFSSSWDLIATPIRRPPPTAAASSAVKYPRASSHLQVMSLHRTY